MEKLEIQNSVKYLGEGLFMGVAVLWKLDYRSL